MGSMICTVHQYIPQSALRQVHGLFQGECSIQCELVLLFQFPVSYRFFKAVFLERFCSRNTI
jgi:hypothetical protein